MRSNWSKQSQRLYDHVRRFPGVDLPQPELNSAAAGPNEIYVNSFTKRVSEVRSRLRAEGRDLVLSRDEWKDGQRHTWYRLT